MLFCGVDLCLYFGYFVQVDVWSWCYGLHASTYWDLHCETTYEVEKAKSVQILNVKYNHSVPVMTNIPQENFSEYI